MISRNRRRTSPVQRIFLILTMRMAQRMAREKTAAMKVLLSMKTATGHSSPV